jgi:hypothetical protein
LISDLYFTVVYQRHTGNVAFLKSKQAESTNWFGLKFHRAVTSALNTSAHLKSDSRARASLSENQGTVHMYTKYVVAMAVMAMSSGLTGQAAAGVAPNGTQNLSMLVQQDGGSSWNLNLSGLMAYDAATGGLSLDSSKLSSPVSDALGQWTWASASSLDLDGTTSLAADRIKWHSWERADGTSGTSADAGNPWASTFTFTASGNVDPFMSYGFTVKNNSGAVQTYTFSMGESLIPSINGSYDVLADVSGSIINGAGANVTITPAFGDQDGDSIAELQVLRLSSDGGATYINAGVDVGQADSFSGTGGHLYGLYNASRTSAGNYNYWALETKFTLTPGQDVASLAGYAQITPVPEPEQFGMLLTGFGLMGAIARRRIIAK